MTKYFTEDESVDTINGRMGIDADDRAAVVMESLVRHLHSASPSWVCSAR
ncbi:hypothetical protein [Rhodococcus sp. JS3073]|nr:hypothetical protein [Rhodococcus sp. JS3073]WAM19722.1 hypothetical protein OYT95_39405 [Rhodococcus sp. JS3073]